MYTPSGPRIREIRSRWCVEESRAIAAERIDAAIRVAMDSVWPSRAASQDGDVFRRTVRRPFSLYDDCEIVVSASVADEASTLVTVEVWFDASEGRVDAYAWLGTSVVGLPLAYGWREISVARARAYAADAIRRFFDVLARVASREAYR